MTLGLITILIPPLLLPSSLQAESTQEKSSLHHERAVLEEDGPPTPLNSLQETHNFQLAFDEPTFGGVPYESFQ